MPRGAAMSVCEHLGDAPTGCAPDDLADEVAERVRVVAHRRARLPPRLLLLERAAHGGPVADVLDGGGRRQPRHPGRVGEHLTHGHVLLAVGRELRPDLGHLGVVAEVPARHAEVRAGRGQALADRPVVEGRGTGDRSSRCRVGDARDGVDDQVVSVVHRHLEAALGARRDEGVDGVLHPLLEVSHDRADRPGTSDSSPVVAAVERGLPAVSVDGRLPVLAHLAAVGARCPGDPLPRPGAARRRA